MFKHERLYANHRLISESAQLSFAVVSSRLVVPDPPTGICFCGLDGVTSVDLLTEVSCLFSQPENKTGKHNVARITNFRTVQYSNIYYISWRPFNKSERPSIRTKTCSVGELFHDSQKNPKFAKSLRIFWQIINDKLRVFESNYRLEIVSQFTWRADNLRTDGR